MKLATLKNNTRDGKLVIVNRELTLAVDAAPIAQTMQQALDSWATIKPLLEERYQKLNDNTLKNTFPFIESEAHSPLPRAYHWADGSAYVNHVELVRKARGASLPENFWHDPLMYQGGSDTFLAPHQPIPFVDQSWGLDFESEIAIITNDVPAGTTANDAEQHICLIMLVNDVSLRGLIPEELSKGFGFYQSKPSSAFSPVAITPDELHDAWDGRKVSLPLLTHYNGAIFGSPDAGIDMTFDFPALIAHAAKTRSLGAGTIIGSGTVSNYDKTKGSSCLAEKRMLEIIETGKPLTSFMKAGDTVKIEMLKDGQSIFGSINQDVVAANSEQAIYAKTV